MNNMDIYEASRSVPDSAKKQFDNGTFKGTDINPMWRIKKLTELFGPCGAGWKYELVEKHCEEHHDMTMAIVDVKLYWNVTGDWSNPTWSAPIYGTGGNRLVYQTQKRGTVASDEGYKMALTDAIGVACKNLGIGADVYYDKDVSSKYAQYYGAEQRPPKGAKPTAEMIEMLKVLSDDKQKDAMIEKYGEKLEKLDYATCKRIIEKLGGKVDE